MDKLIIAAMSQVTAFGRTPNCLMRRCLDDTQLHKPFTNYQFTILGSFVHTVSAEWRWYQSWTGVPMEERLTANELPTIEAVRARWETVS